jgi:hypothetical protein
MSGLSARLRDRQADGPCHLQFCLVDRGDGGADRRDGQPGQKLGRVFEIGAGMVGRPARHGDEKGRIARASPRAAARTASPPSDRSRSTACGISATSRRISWSLRSCPTSLAVIGSTAILPAKGKVAEMTKTLVVGLGNMGVSHALAHHANPAFRDRRAGQPLTRANCPPRWRATPGSTVSRRGWRRGPTSSSSPPIPTATPTSPSRAMEAGAHVFVEKPLATTVADAERVVETATAPQPKARRGLHPAPPPQLDPDDRRGPRPGRALTSSA